MSDVPEEPLLNEDIERQVGDLQSLPPGERESALRELVAAYPGEADLIHALAGLLSMEDDIPSAPARIGSYRIERVLGEGGMGTVFLPSKRSQFVAGSPSS